MSSGDGTRDDVGIPEIRLEPDGGEREAVQPAGEGLDRLREVPGRASGDEVQQTRASRKRARNKSSRKLREQAAVEPEQPPVEPSGEQGEDVLQQPAGPVGQQDPGGLFVRLESAEIADVAHWVAAHIQLTQKRLTDELAEAGIVFTAEGTVVSTELVERLRARMLDALQSAFTLPAPAPEPPPAPVAPPPPPPVAAQTSAEMSEGTVKQLAEGIAQALARPYAPAPMSAPNSAASQYDPSARSESPSSSRYPLGAFLASGGA